MTPAEFRTHRDALGISTEFLASQIGCHLNMIGRYEHPSRKLPVPEHAAAAMRQLLAQWDAAADRLSADARKSDVLQRRINVEEFYELVPELRGWGHVAQGLLLAEVQRRVQLGIEWR